MTQRPASALHRAALAAAHRGWRVFPLRPDDKRPTGHSEANCPVTGRCADGHLKPEQRATIDVELIRRCWTQAPYGIGIATGPSGLVVVDLDVPKGKKEAPDGATTFQALCERAGQPWPDTYTVRTASGGRHLYFTAPTGIRLGNTASKLGPGIDTRAWGGYVVAPGSTVRGRPYETLHAREVAPLPDWLMGLLAPAPKPQRPLVEPTVHRASAYARAALRNETHAVATSHGHRNEALMRAARALGRLVASGDLDRTDVEEALSASGEAAGLSPHYCHGVITSALNWSIAHNDGTRKSAS